MRKEEVIDRALDTYLVCLKQLLLEKAMMEYENSPICDTPDFEVNLNFGDDNYCFYMRVEIDGKTKLFGGEYGLDGIEI